MSARGRSALGPCFALAALLSGCAYPNERLRGEPARAWSEPLSTHLGARFQAALQQHPGCTGIYPLGQGLDAFAARALLCAAAERTLDLQYYILRDDDTGRLLIDQWVAAADRGVRVRLLIDDAGTKGLDETLAALDAHPQIEVRLFNAFARGSPRGLVRALDMLRRPKRLNHRMHNKLLAVDGAAAVVGGRNLADEYFDADPSVNFADFDLLVLGPVLSELGECFDRYWNSEFATPVAAWTSLRAEESELVALRERLAAHAIASHGSPYAQRLRTSNIVERVLAGELPLMWGPMRAVADSPEKVVAEGEALERALLTTQLREHVTRVERDLTIVSPYFVPGEAGAEFFRALRRRGVRVRVLTNSYSASDVSAVHAGYSSYRRDLLAEGVELYELRPTSAAVDQARAQGSFGSSGASLHAKTFCVDGSTVFVGSLNLDPRSVDLNTELGLVVESRELAELVMAGFERGARPGASWRLSLEGRGHSSDVVWNGEVDGAQVATTDEPDFGFWSGVWIGFLKLLPIEGQL